MVKVCSESVTIPLKIIFDESWKILTEADNLIKKETLAQVFSCEFCEISKNTSLHRTPLVAASDYSKNIFKIVNKKLFYIVNKELFYVVIHLGGKQLTLEVPVLGPFLFLILYK